MELRARTVYGIVALIELAAIHGSDQLLQVGEIARRQGIPERYLEQMLTSLRRAGLLHSSRGPRGGYRLARPPASIHLDEVVHCLEGDQTPEARQARTSSDAGAGASSSAEFAVLEALEERLRQARGEILRRTRLDQLLEERQALSEPQPMFFI